MKTSQIIVRRDNKLDKLDYSKKLLYKGFMAFDKWWEEFLVVSGRIDNKEA